MKEGIYRHYKGGLFLVLGVGTLEETLESAVIYQHLEGDYAVWIRKQSVFEELLTPDGTNAPEHRFSFVRRWTERDALKHPQALPLLKKSEKSI
jgi:hypothetical protein